jgi:hypothetical protein
MKIRTFLISAALIGLAGSAMAGDDVKRTMKIEVIGEDSSNGTHFIIDSDDLGIDLHEMQEGESRSIVDESGQSILITRQAEGYSLNIDGKTIELPEFSGEGVDGMHWMADADDTEVEFHVLHGGDMTMATEISGTMIFSPKPIDETTQQAIKSLLLSAGYDSEVNFVDRKDAPHREVMTKKQVM